MPLRWWHGPSNGSLIRHSGELSWANFWGHWGNWGDRKRVWDHIVDTREVSCGWPKLLSLATIQYLPRCNRPPRPSPASNLSNICRLGSWPDTLELADQAQIVQGPIGPNREFRVPPNVNSLPSSICNADTPSAYRLPTTSTTRHSASTFPLEPSAMAPNGISPPSRSSRGVPQRSRLQHTLRVPRRAILPYRRMQGKGHCPTTYLVRLHSTVWSSIQYVSFDVGMLSSGIPTALLRTSNCHLSISSVILLRQQYLRGNDELAIHMRLQGRRRGLSAGFGGGGG